MTSTPDRRRRWIRAALLASVAIVVASVVSLGAAARSEAPPQWLVSARAQLAKLDTKPAASMTSYSREQFGPAWEDVDNNGCDTRDDILRRDLTHVVFKQGSSCVVASGTLHDPYTGKTIKFVRGVKTSSAVQIDHVVALADAWRTGARNWTASRRLGYANSRLVLLAVDGPANEAKGDGDASEWLPPRAAFQCRYVARQISIKRRYHLWVTSTERAAMLRVLSNCP